MSTMPPQSSAPGGGGRGPPRKPQSPGRGHTATERSFREKWNTKLRSRVALGHRSKVRFSFLHFPIDSSS